MTRILTAIAAWLAVTIPAAASLAQDAAPQADGADTFASVYLAIGGVVMAGLGWLISWGVGKLKGNYAKETAGRFLSHLDTALQGSHARFKQGLEAARDKDSPGGAVITDEEWGALRDDMWEYLKKQYGSMDGIASVVGIFTGGKGEEAAKAFVDSKIDAGIAAMEKADKSGKPGPA